MLTSKTLSATALIRLASGFAATEITTTAALTVKAAHFAALAKGFATAKAFTIAAGGELTRRCSAKVAATAFAIAKTTAGTKVTAAAFTIAKATASTKATTITTCITEIALGTVTKAGTLAVTAKAAASSTAKPALAAIAAAAAKTTLAAWCAFAAATAEATAVVATCTTAAFGAAGEALLWLQSFNGLGFELQAGKAFNIKNTAAVTEFGKGHGHDFAPSAAGAANAVGVVLGLHGQAVVEDVGDGGYVNAACGHVGGNQNLNLPFTQCPQTAVAQPLAQCAMQSGGRETGFCQVLRQAVALHLRGGKHDGLVDGGVTQPVVQQLALVLGMVSPVQFLLDVVVALLGRGDGDFLHIGTAGVHHAHGQLLNERRKGGAEHHGLLALGGHLVNLFQIIGKTQVEHAVGLSDHQELHLVQLDLQAALQVQQTARRGHDQIGVLQLGNL